VNVSHIPKFEILGCDRQSLNKMQEWIIKVMTQFRDGSTIEPNGILSKWRNDCGVLARDNVRSPRLIGALFH
jgi:hypothetical protein